MKKFLLFSFIMILISSFAFSRESFLPSGNSKVQTAPEYYIYFEQPTSFGKPVGKVIPIYRVPQEYIIPNALHLKTKSFTAIDKYSNRVLNSSISQILGKYPVRSVRAPFIDDKATQPLTNNTFGIERILEVYFDEGVDIYQICKELVADPNVEYAVPIYIRHTFAFTPNDPLYSQQWYIKNIKLPEAWDISKGDKKIFIAIVDSGVDWEHPDLNANIWINPMEIPDNGIDDDGNGKIDDVRGWDLVGNVTTQDILNNNWREDNDPKNISGFHGTHVAGCASAVTNNGVGIASPGFSCSILPVKCSPDQGSTGIFRGYEGIVYAANLGAHIINCSWGGPGFSPAEQDIINYATGLGSLVVVAAGNDGAYIDYGGFYPACYDNVLCVGATNSSNAVASFSNWGSRVTVYAPGQSIYSTIPNNRFSNQNGTSMASPVASGVAALVRAYHKEWTPKQVLHQIRSTSDNVLAQNQDNRPYYYGKINAYNALYYNSVGNPGIPGLEITDFVISRGTALSDYDLNVVQLKIKNFLGYAANTTMKIKLLNNYATLSQTDFSLGNLSTNAETVVNVGVQLLENNPWYLGNLNLLCIFQSGSYTDFQIVSIPIQMNSENKLSTVFSLPNQYAPNWTSAHSPNGETFWAVGNGGLFATYSGFLVYRSGSYGMNYLSNQQVYAVFGLNSTTAFVGSGTQNQSTAYIYKTTNGGQNWTSTNVSTITGFINAIYFFDDNNGIFLGDPKNNAWGVAKTNNSGSSWTPITNIPAPLSNETGLVKSTYCLGNYLWFGTTAGRVFYSTDMGESWKVATIQNAVMVVQIGFQDSLRGVAIYTESSATNAQLWLAYTTDGGQSWKPRQFNFTSNGYTPVSILSLPNSKYIYFLCSGGEILGTSNFGDTWVPILNEFTGDVKVGAISFVGGAYVKLWQLGSKLSYLLFPFSPAQEVRKLTLMSESVLNYDTLEISKTRMKFVTLKNEGNVEIAINPQIQITTNSELDEFKFFSTPPNSIKPGEEIQIRIRFSPKKSGLREGKLVITSNGDPNLIEVQLIGFGVEPTSVDYYTQALNFELFPNPFENELNIGLSTQTNGNLSVKVINLLGEIIYDFGKLSVSEGSNLLKLNLENIPTGVYLVELNNGVSRYSMIVLKR